MLSCAAKSWLSKLCPLLREAVQLLYFTRHNGGIFQLWWTGSETVTLNYFFRTVCFETHSNRLTLELFKNTKWTFLVYRVAEWSTGVKRVLLSETKRINSRAVVFGPLPDLHD